MKTLLTCVISGNIFTKARNKNIIQEEVELMATYTQA
jgi:hypothetical protein